MGSLEVGLCVVVRKVEIRWFGPSNSRGNCIEIGSTDLFTRATSSNLRSYTKKCPAITFFSEYFNLTLIFRIFLVFCVEHCVAKKSVPDGVQEPTLIPRLFVKSRS